MTFLLTIAILSMILLSSSSPITMIVILIFSAIMSSIMILKIQMSYWLLVAVILGLVGGLMILFIYSTSLIPNEKILMSNPLNKIMLAYLLIIMKPTMNKAESMNFENNNMMEIYTSQYIYVFFIITLILVMLNFAMKIIFNPMNSLKSFFYENSNKSF